MENEFLYEFLHRGKPEGEGAWSITLAEITDQTRRRQLNAATAISEGWDLTRVASSLNTATVVENAALKTLNEALRDQASKDATAAKEALDEMTTACDNAAARVLELETQIAGLQTEA